MSNEVKIAILGTGNIGRAIATGLVTAGHVKPGETVLTRRRVDLLEDLRQDGFLTSDDNHDAVRRAERVVVAVEPQQVDGLLDEIAGDLDAGKHTLISVVSGATIADMRSRVGPDLPVVRAMPNTAIALGRSMTCIAVDSSRSDVQDEAVRLFDAVGRTLVIPEEQMVSATALCACGVAFFLRAIRSASQGGIEIGFHPGEAVAMAAQTALGAASLVLGHASHPEGEIDNVTTPRGCTIAGLNEMEHRGFSSALIKGIVMSADKAERLYPRDDRGDD